MKGVIALSAALVVISTVFAFADAKKAPETKRQPAGESGRFYCSEVNRPLLADQLNGGICDPNKGFSVYAIPEDSSFGVVRFCCVTK